MLRLQSVPPFRRHYCCGRYCFGKTDTLDEEEEAQQPAFRPPSHANLAAQHELHSLAAARATDTQQAGEMSEDTDTDDEHAGRPLKRFAVRLTSISSHMPDITKRFARMSFSRKSKEDDSFSRTSKDQAEGARIGGIGSAAHVLPENQAVLGGVPPAAVPAEVPTTGVYTQPLAQAV